MEKNKKGHATNAQQVEIKFFQAPREVVKTVCTRKHNKANLRHKRMDFRRNLLQKL